MKNRIILIFAVLAFALLFLGNSSLLITDSVESNYALTAKEMVTSGDWLSPQIYGKYWFDKPIFFYWLTAISFKLLGFTEFAARLFPALFAVFSLALVYWGGKKLYNKQAGIFSAIILLCSVEFFLIGKSVITDSVLFLFFSGTLLFFYLGYSGDSRYFYLMYLCGALATLTKGPVGFLLPGLIILLFLIKERNWQVLKRIHLIKGVILFLVVALPWYGIMYVLHGSDFIDVFFGTHNFLRATVSEHPRDNVIYYYTLVNLLALFPWSGLFLVIFYQKITLKNFVWSAKEHFLLLWAGTVFVFYQCMATKYLTYTYPLLFPLAIFLGGCLEKQFNIIKNKFYLVFTLFGSFTLICAAYLAVYKWHIAGENLFYVPLSMMVTAVLCLHLIKSEYSIFYLIGSTHLVLYIALIFCIAVPFSMQRSAKDAGEFLRHNYTDKMIGVYGCYPTSAVFYADRQIVRLLPSEAVNRFAPQAYSWSSKNVMPYADINEKSYDVILVKDNAADEFYKKTSAKWDIEQKIGVWNVLLRR